MLIISQHELLPKYFLNLIRWHSVALKARKQFRKFLRLTNNQTSQLNIGKSSGNLRFYKALGFSEPSCDHLLSFTGCKLAESLVETHGNSLVTRLVFVVQRLYFVVRGRSLLLDPRASMSLINAAVRPVRISTIIHLAFESKARAILHETRVTSHYGVADCSVGLVLVRSNVNRRILRVSR